MIHSYCLTQSRLQRCGNKVEPAVLCVVIRRENLLTSAMSDAPRGCGPREARGRSRPGRHVGGQDVVRVPVQVVAGPVIPHGRTRVGVPGGDLHVAQVSAVSSMVVTYV